MTGGLGGESRNIQANLICGKFATKLHAKSMFLYSPVLLDSIEAKNIMLQQSFIKDVLMVAKQANILLAGIGGSPSFSTLATSHIHKIDSEIEENYPDIVGDFCYNFIDIDGNIVECEWNKRVVTLGIQQIKNIPLVIAVAEGKEKTNSIFASLNGGLIHALILDELTAREVLKKKQQDI